MRFLQELGPTIVNDLFGYLSMFRVVLCTIYIQHCMIQYVCNHLFFPHENSKCGLFFPTTLVYLPTYLPYPEEARICGRLYEIQEIKY